MSHVHPSIPPTTPKKPNSVRPHRRAKSKNLIAGLARWHRSQARLTSAGTVGLWGTLAGTLLWLAVAPTAPRADFYLHPLQDWQIASRDCSARTNVGATAQRQPIVGRIHVRQSSNGPEFYNTLTDQLFAPRGNNYIRLAWLDDPWGGKNFGHSLFHPAHYERVCARHTLNAMTSRGYNVVRVFVSEISAGNPTGPGVNIAYVQNLADFLSIAKDSDIRVIVTFWRLPRQGGYQLRSTAPRFMEGVNAYYLYQPLIDARKRYVKDFIAALQSLGAPLEAVFAWDLENEAHLMESQKPLSLSSGIIKAANGTSYDMASSVDRERMIDEGLVYWANQVGATIKETAPNSLVTMSFFSPAVVSGSDPRITRTKLLIADPKDGGASIDFVDIHIYPGRISIQKELVSFEISPSRKPLVLGEMGIWMWPDSGAKTASSALEKLRNLQIISCRSEFRVVGWVLYSWDTFETAEGRRDLFTAADDRGRIESALSPKNLPDPCIRTTAHAN